MGKQNYWPNSSALMFLKWKVFQAGNVLVGVSMFVKSPLTATVTMAVLSDTCALECSDDTVYGNDTSKRFKNRQYYNKVTISLQNIQAMVVPLKTTWIFVTERIPYDTGYTEQIFTLYIKMHKAYSIASFQCHINRLLHEYYCTRPFSLKVLNQA